ncbi:MAG: thiamine-phosphate kinase [Gammaproteobacteria bacterium]|nr:thiamine-phosphate kinase [Gammaproteobacteria bacterium]
MPQSEFDIIKEYFQKQKTVRDDVCLGIGDDAAIITVPQSKQLAIALDTLVAGVHFPTETSAEDVAYKALAVNLSDLAAMGAEPAWFTLGITLPESNTDWLKNFASGLFSLADQYNVQLIGGDTTQGPLTVTIQVAGLLPEGKALKRDGANEGDLIYVTGSLGDAALGLKGLQHPDIYPVTPQLIDKLNRPQPRLEVGHALLDIASACIDVSDGLLADLGHILDSSGVGASVDRAQLPLSDTLQAQCDKDDSRYHLALTGGDDYELCFCVSPDRQQDIHTISNRTGVLITCIGTIEQQPGLRLHHAGNLIDTVTQSGYEHFA